MPRKGTTADSCNADASLNAAHLRAFTLVTKIRIENRFGHTVSATSAFRKSTMISPFALLVIELTSPND